MIDNLLSHFTHSFQGSVLLVVRPAVHRDIELFRVFQIHVLVIGAPLADRHAEAYLATQNGYRIVRIFFEVDGKKGQYCRSRSGCYFCFFQQKIEWIWLYEQHPDLFKKAMEYEKDGYTWIQGEPLSELIRPERVRQIKLDQIKKQEEAKAKSKSKLLVDLFDDEINCANCFI